MSLSDDPLNNASPKTRQRFENALEKWRSEVLAQQAQSSASQTWAHWEYSPDEWALFDRVDWGLRGFFFRVLLIGNIVFLLGAIPPWFFLNSDPNLFAVAFSADMLLLGGFFLFLIFYSPSYAGASKRHKARQNLPRTVTFSMKGVWEAGTFFPMNERFEVDLKKVTLTSQPPVLHFRLKHSSEDADSTTSTMSTTLRVLVPREQEGEAGLLLERFQTEVIAARKAEGERARQEEERRKNPPEPL